MHIPGLKVVTPGTPADAKGLLKSAIRDDNPVLVLEGEMLYNTKGEVPDGEHLVPLGVAELKREGEHCSIITNGKMVLVALQAADQLAKEGIQRRRASTCARSGRWMWTRSGQSVRKTNRAVVLEEGWEMLPGSARRSRTHPARVLRRPRRAGPSRPPGRRADALRQESRASRQARCCQDHRAVKRVMYLDS